ncbi:flagellar motor switch phosphatase FliY [Paenibacillus larvae]|uniref:flagellar motor switch phosphatase FliY n=1 Tax=Paenibacillus larvae TaxID=1464 RepID=UPI00041B4365|nr:flagellar motor switch phosphatase FliY [Paenibacillus larvae]AVG12486.1 flagellar motor switch phosphatase FliY [Paenibacillus larvae subsp. larvae DSM 25430]MDR5569491.1 flagellar motor switch phosphatase FliY [Paenibacillus larvae]MDR5596223.1 flagellar motor switch phosphatase FliY [Paenibacillus larvae]
MTNNKDYLSQEEIDALLMQTSDDRSDSSEGGSSYSPAVEDFLSGLEQDALGEIGNITFGSAATALSTLLGKKVEITTPKVSVIAREDLVNEFPKPHVAVHVKYVDGFHGINLLVIKRSDAQVIADLMMGGDGHPETDELSEIHLSAVQEAMNQMMGSSATSMSTIFNRLVNISPPGIDIMRLSEGEGNLPNEDVFIKISFRLTIGDLIDSTIMQLLPVDFSKEMVSNLLGEGTQTEEETAAALTMEPELTSSASIPEEKEVQPPMPASQHDYTQAPPARQQPHEGGSAYPASPAYKEEPAASSGMMQRNVNVQPVQFSNLQAGGYAQADETNLNLLLDIPLKVTVELGRTNKMIKDILELQQGSIVELDKLAGEPVDILVNNKLIAKGEVVVIDENFGVRVTDIVSQFDRIQKIQ